MNTSLIGHTVWISFDPDCPTKNVEGTIVAVAAVMWNNVPQWTFLIQLVNGDAGNVYERMLSEIRWK